MVLVAHFGTNDADTVKTSNLRNGVLPFQGLLHFDFMIPQTSYFLSFSAQTMRLGANFCKKDAQNMCNIVRILKVKEH